MAWIELASVQQASQLPAAIAGALGCRIVGEPLEGLLSALAPLQILLALDNAEHLADDLARLVQTLLNAAPGVRILVTSQLPLRLASERVYRLQALAVPDRKLTAAEALGYGAIALFAERAQAADRRFALTDDNVGTVTEICRRLDGMALAIELAAARAEVLGVDALAAALDSRFQLLTSGARAIPARQRTLRAALEWSHGLLGDDERLVFRRLGVFTGSFRLQWAQAVCADPGRDEWAVLDVLASLVERSLVSLEGDDPPRYRLLETPRDFARERLAEAGEEELARRRHAGALRVWLESANEQFFTRAQSVDAWRLAVGADVEDGRAALAWAADHDPEAAVALAPCLAWAMINASPAARRPIWDTTAPLLERVDDASLRLRWRVIRGFLNTMTFQFADVQDEIADIAEAARRLDDRRAIYLSMAQLVNIEVGRAPPACDLGRAAAALQVMREAEDPAWPPALRYHRMRIEAEYWRESGDLQEAIAWIRRAVALAEEADDSRGRYSALVYLTDTEVELGCLEDAISEATRLVAALQGTRNVATLVHARVNLGAALIWRGSMFDAREVARSAWPASASFGLLYLWADHFALAAALEGRPCEAARLAGYSGSRRAALRASRQRLEARSIARAEQLARQRLGPPQFERCLAEGAELSDLDLERITFVAGDE
jgi:predicted ATPase